MLAEKHLVGSGSISLPPERGELARAASHELGQLVIGDGLATPGIDSDINHPVVLTPLPMRMAVEQPSATVDRTLLQKAVLLLAVTAIGKVRNGHQSFRHLDLEGGRSDMGEACVEVGPFPFLRAAVLRLAAPTAIMVARNQGLLSEQSAHRLERPGDESQGDVTNHHDLVIRSDRGIPSFDECFVHVLHVGEWTLRIANDVGMAEMEIAGPKAHTPCSRLGSRRRTYSYGVAIWIILAGAVGLVAIVAGVVAVVIIGTGERRRPFRLPGPGRRLPGSDDDPATRPR